MNCYILNYNVGVNCEQVTLMHKYITNHHLMNTLEGYIYLLDLRK